MAFTEQLELSFKEYKSLQNIQKLKIIFCNTVWLSSVDFEKLRYHVIN